MDTNGAVPEIRADGDSVIFCLEVPSEHARLIIRCNPDGGENGTLSGQDRAGQIGRTLIVREDLPRSRRASGRR